MEVDTNITPLEGGLRKTSVVSSYPAGQSAFGCEDMAGNMWEWTDRSPQTDDNARVLRGGSWAAEGDTLDELQEALNQP